MGDTKTRDALRAGFDGTVHTGIGPRDLPRLDFEGLKRDANIRRYRGGNRRENVRHPSQSRQRARVAGQHGPHLNALHLRTLLWRHDLWGWQLDYSQFPSVVITPTSLGEENLVTTGMLLCYR